MGVLQANEALKEILGIGKSMAGRFLLFDALNPSFEILEILPNPNCPLCGEKPAIQDLIDYPVTCDDRPPQ